MSDVKQRTFKFSFNAKVTIKSQPRYEDGYNLSGYDVFVNGKKHFVNIKLIRERRYNIVPEREKAEEIAYARFVKSLPTNPMDNCITKHLLKGGENLEVKDNGVYSRNEKGLKYLKLIY